MGDARFESLQHLRQMSEEPTRPVHDAARALLAGRAVKERRAQLKGVTDEMSVYEIA